MAFEFADAARDDILAYLATREGKDFVFRELLISLEGGTEVNAYVPVYEGQNLSRCETISQKASMVRRAKGTSGPCLAYVKGIWQKLSELGIDDPSVSELWQAVKERA